jgi:uncharacterized protein (TIGR03083 family)
MITEYARVIDQLKTLSAAEWSAPTCNTGWDVRALAAHLTGTVAMAASLREQIRQMRAAGRRQGDGDFIDALTALQVEMYEGRSTEELTAEYERLAPKAVTGRMRTPGFVRSRSMPQAQPVEPGKRYERWTVGFLVDVILTRDPWVHRSDIAIATGREFVATAEHDGAIVDDVVREWAQRHDQPCSLTLTGVAGGTWTFGVGGPALKMDAIEFCRVLSGRGPGDGLLATRVAV